MMFRRMRTSPVEMSRPMNLETRAARSGQMLLQPHLEDLAVDGLGICFHFIGLTLTTNR